MKNNKDIKERKTKDTDITHTVGVVEGETVGVSVGVSVGVTVGVSVGVSVGVLIHCGQQIFTSHAWQPSWKRILELNKDSISTCNSLTNLTKKAKSRGKFSSKRFPVWKKDWPFRKIRKYGFSSKDVNDQPSNNEKGPGDEKFGDVSFSDA